MSNDISLFLKACDELKETEFHQRVVMPFLESLGATNIQYMHGNTERGKDFLYMMPSCYGGSEMHACVVKNGKFNGRSGDSNSVQTALHQIATSKRIEELNPITANMETPQKVLFIANRNLPSKHIANCSRQIDDLKDYSVLCMGEEFGIKFKEKCYDIFCEILRPGSHIAQRLAAAVELHNESHIFKLPLGKSTRIFVDMRLISASEKLKLFLEAKRKPLEVLTEHVEKDFVHYVQFYQRCFQDIADLPTIFSIDNPKANRESSSTTELTSKVFVESIALDKLYDAVEQLHCSKEHNDSIFYGDMLFSLHQLLGELIERFGDLDFSEPCVNNSLGVFGCGNDAVEILSKCTDNLYIVGDPGGGKTYSAQELAKEAFNEGRNVVYFPCSQISEGISLVGAIENYIASVARCTQTEAQKYLSNCTTIILDGLDEALTIEQGLIYEIMSLVNDATFTVELPENKSFELERLPTSITEKLELRSNRNKCVLRVIERLHWDEAELLLRVLEGGNKIRSFDKSKLRPYRRVIVTCRETTSIELGGAFRKLRLLPFSTEELNEFVRKHCVAASCDPDRLLSFLEKNDYIREVCSSPLTATIMIGIYLRGSDLPACRAELYDTRAHLLLREWDSARGVDRPTSGSEQAKLRILSSLAFHMHSIKHVEITIDDAIAFLEREFSEVALGATHNVLIKDLIKHHGLLQERLGKLSFGHLSHQEFFAARHSVFRQQIGFLAKQFNQAWWRNVLHFFVGLSGTADDLLMEVHRTVGLLGHKNFVLELTNEGKFSADFSRFVRADYLSR